MDKVLSVLAMVFLTVAIVYFVNLIVEVFKNRRKKKMIDDVVEVSSLEHFKPMPRPYSRDFILLRDGNVVRLSSVVALTVNPNYTITVHLSNGETYNTMLEMDELCKILQFSVFDLDKAAHKLSEEKKHEYMVE